MHNAEDMKKALEFSLKRRSTIAKNRIKGLELAIYMIEKTFESFEEGTVEYNAMVKLIDEMKQELEGYRETWSKHAKANNLKEELL